MRTVQVLSTLALKRLLRSAGPLPQNEVGTANLREALQSNHHVARALRQANARAWIAVEVLLAGEEFWERAQLTWERRLDAEFFLPLRRFLDKNLLASPADQGDSGLAKAGQTLRAASASTLLTSGPLELDEVLASLGTADGVSSEWRPLEQLIARLEDAGYAELRSLLSLHSAGTESLLVLLVTALFRQAVEVDSDLFGNLITVCKQSAADPLLEEFRGLAVALDRHRDRIDAILRALHEPTDKQEKPPIAVDATAGEARLERGKSCVQRGDYEQAIGEYTLALQMLPASAEAFASRGDANRLKGDYPQALADYNSALRLDPSNARVLIQRGQLQWIMGQPREGVADFTAAIDVDGKNAIAYHYRGKALADAGDLDGALTNFSETLRLEPYHAWAHHDAGQARAAKGDYDRAIADFSESLRLNPLATLSYLRRGDAWTAKGEFDRAVADYGNVLRLDPHNILGYVGLGRAYRKRGHYELALAELTRALEIDFANVRLYYERGLVFQAQGNHQRALLDFNAAVSRDENHAEAIFRRGLSHNALGAEKQALADLTRAVRIDPTHAAAFNHRGTIYAAGKEIDLALADFNTALSLDTQFAAAFLNRARILLDSNKLEQSLADCNHALQFEPKLTGAHLVRGSLLARRGEYTAAINDFSRSLQENPRNAQVFYLRGVACLRQGKVKDAVADLSEAIRLDPNYARAYAQRAAIRKASRMHKLALEDLAHAARLDVQLVPAYCRQMGSYHASLGMFECAAADFTAALCLDPKNAAAKSGRKQAWQDYLNRPQKRENAAETLQQRGSKFPRLVDTKAPATDQTTFLAAETPPEQKSRSSKTIIAPAQETATPSTVPETTAHPVLQETAAHQVSPEISLETQPLRDDESPEAVNNTTNSADSAGPTLAPIEAPASVGNLAFKLNVPVEMSETEEELSSSTDVEVLDDDKKEELSLETGIHSESKTPDDASQEDSAPRRNFLEKVRLADASRSKELGEQRKREFANKEKQRRKKADENADVPRMALWKKGILVAASIFVLYFTFGFGWEFFAAQRAMTKPVPVAVSGKVLSGADGQGLSEVMVRFHPQRAPGMEASAVTDKNGYFTLGTFTQKDGAVAGPYVVTVEPVGRRSASSVPPEYIRPEKTPIKVEVKRSGPNELDPFKIKL